MSAQNEQQDEHLSTTAIIAILHVSFSDLVVSYNNQQILQLNQLHSTIYLNKLWLLMFQLLISS